MSEFEIFQAALELDDLAARQQFLVKTCGDDATLLTRVEALLASHASQSQFLNVPVGEQLTDSSELGNAATIVSGQESTHDEDDEISLEFLGSSSKPGSLGRLGHYEVLEVIGRGAFGTVLRAFDEKLHRMVAIKVVARELANTSPARKRFLREAQASAAIRHEHVVAIYAVEEHPLPYLVMEFIPGQTLQQRLNQKGPLDVLNVLRLGQQIANGLAAAHAINLIHRDIKPANILLETGIEDRVKITDFGLARTADDASLTQSGMIAGTPMYMAPEQALGKDLDQRADLFSLGSVLYQMVSGRPPFRAPSALAVLKRVAEETPRPIQAIIPETPDWLCSIIAKLHAKNPAERYQSAREVADVLADCEEQLKVGSKLHDFSRIPQSGPTAFPKKSRFKIAGTIGLLLLIAIVVTLINWENTPTRVGSPDDDNVPVPSGSDDTTTADVPEPPFTPKPAKDAVPAPDSASQALAQIAPLTDADIERIAALPGEKQIEEVRKELMRLNPGFDGQMDSTLTDGVVTRLQFSTRVVTDITPLRSLRGLQALNLSNTFLNEGKLSDLSPLKGLPLVALELDYTEVSDLTPLTGMQLELLRIYVCTKVSDLSPLKGMPLTSLQIGRTRVQDLSPLQGMPLGQLYMWMTPVSDLGPLAGMPITTMNIDGTKVSDLRPLAGMRLREIHIAPANFPQGLEILREIRSLEIIGTPIKPYPAAEFWRRYDSGEFTR